jgi:lipoprotein NlpI
MKSIWEFIKKKLINAQKSQKRYADQKRVISLDYVIENIVWLFIKNIKTKRSFRKLNHKWIESYKIKKILKEAC